MSVQAHAKKRKGQREVIDKKIAVFEKTQKQQINRDADYEQQFAFCFIALVRKPYAHRIIGNGTEQYQKEKAPIPPAIKNIAGNDGERVLRQGVLTSGKPV
jgi:hypothetical protein